MSGAGPQQLPLPVQLRDDATLENFLPAPATGPLVAALRALATEAGEAIIFIHGAAGTGKSHLLQASCHLVGRGAMYLPLAEMARFSPEDVLQGADGLRLVCLDDVDRVLGQPDWELALFNLCNLARQHNCCLLVSAAAAPRALTIELADLRSRLSWGIVYQLPVADDAKKMAILRYRANLRGLVLGDDACNYLVSRAPRDMAALLGLLERLDKASLVERRALSIPFIKGVLGW